MGMQVDLEEFVSTFRKLGTLDFDPELMASLIAKYSVDSDDEISMLEFIAMMVSDDPLVNDRIIIHSFMVHNDHNHDSET